MKKLLLIFVLLSSLSCYSSWEGCDKVESNFCGTASFLNNDYESQKIVAEFNRKIVARLNETGGLTTLSLPPEFSVTLRYRNELEELKDVEKGQRLLRDKKCNKIKQLEDLLRCKKHNSTKRSELFILFVQAEQNEIHNQTYYLIDKDKQGDLKNDDDITYLLREIAFLRNINRIKDDYIEQLQKYI